MCNESNKLKTNIEELKKEVLELEQEVFELKKKDDHRFFDNVLCDCIDKFYIKILDSLEVNGYLFETWQGLMRKLDKNVALKHYLETIIQNPPFNLTIEEWKSIKNFKKQRNENSHQNPNVDLLDQLGDGDLKEGLNKVLANVFEGNK